MRSFWRTYNLISIIGCAGMGVAFIVGGIMVPILRVGFIFGGLTCLGVGRHARGLARRVEGPHPRHAHARPDGLLRGDGQRQRRRPTP